jgi:hypothetical protein
MPQKINIQIPIYCVWKKGRWLELKEVKNIFESI